MNSIKEHFTFGHMKAIKMKEWILATKINNLTQLTVLYLYTVFLIRGRKAQTLCASSEFVSTLVKESVFSWSQWLVDYK